MGAACSNQTAGQVAHKAPLEALPVTAKIETGVQQSEKSGVEGSALEPDEVSSQQQGDDEAQGGGEKKNTERDEEDEEEDEEGPKSKDQAGRCASLRRCFKALDKDQSSHIDFKELKQYLFKSGHSLESLAARADDLMKRLDMNNDNVISEEEFVSMMEALMAEWADDDIEVWVAEVIYTATSKNVIGFGDSLGEMLSTLSLTEHQTDKLKNCFRALDKDNSGYVEMAELRTYLAQSGVDMREAGEDLSALMTKLDKNEDGKVSEQEFYVTLSLIRKSLLTDSRFDELVNNILKACGGRPVEKPALVDVLLAEPAAAT